MFPLEARHYFLQIMTALELDLVFVEDGVRFKKLQWVIRQIFELYDVFGGDQRAEEKHFVGVPGVRVLIHDFRLDDPFHSETYPEPDYEDVGRARILHVFRERGEEDDEVETPIDMRGIPVPCLTH